MDGNALVIDADGTLTAIKLPATNRLATMYAALRCRLVDVVRLTDKLDMWLDDEGIYNHPVNPYATEFARRFGYVYQDYYGPVLLCSVTDDGNSVDMTADQTRATLTQVGEILAAIGCRP